MDGNVKPRIGSLVLTEPTQITGGNPVSRPSRSVSSNYPTHSPNSDSTKPDSDPSSREKKTAEMSGFDDTPGESSSEDGESPFDSISIPVASRIKQVWAVGGGKGGVGKSMVASSLAIALSRLGNKVVAVDLDLGGANLHTTLGVDLPKQSLSDFFAHRVTQLEKCAVPTGIPNLDLISGAQDAVGVANIKPAQKVRLLQKMRELDADYLVVDLGAGTGFHTLDFFLFADIGVLTCLPEPTSIENVYRFIKSVYYRRLSNSRYLKDIRPLIEMAMDSKNPLNIKSPSDLFREVNRTNPEAGMLLKQEIEKFRPKLIVNQARTQTDIDIGFSIKTVCKKYFGIEMDYIGYLDYDSAVWQAVRRKRPLMLEFPNSRLVSSIERIVHFMIKRYGHHRNDIF
jgi:flagellar biosynthesis protein FlhG